MELKRMTLDNLGNGAALEKFDDEFNKLIEEDREAMLPESYVRPTARIATVPGRTALIIPGNVGKAILPGNVEP